MLMLALPSVKCLNLDSHIEFGLDTFSNSETIATVFDTDERYDPASFLDSRISVLIGGTTTFASMVSETASFNDAPLAVPVPFIKYFYAWE